MYAVLTICVSMILVRVKRYIAVLLLGQDYVLADVIRNGLFKILKHLMFLCAYILKWLLYIFEIFVCSLVKIFVYLIGF